MHVDDGTGHLMQTRVFPWSHSSTYHIQLVELSNDCATDDSCAVAAVITFALVEFGSDLPEGECYRSGMRMQDAVYICMLQQNSTVFGKETLNYNWSLCLFTNFLSP